jgi:hypothetical protein
MAPSRRRGTLGDHDGNQRGKAADRMEPQRARQPCHAGFLGWIGASPPVRSACETSFRVPMAGTVSPLVRSSGGTGSARSTIYIGDVGGDVQPRPATACRCRGPRAVAQRRLRNRGRVAAESRPLDKGRTALRYQGWTVNEIPSTPVVTRLC